jgi:DNA-binding response OmpR family regulator
MVKGIKTADLKILVGSGQPSTLEIIHSYLAPAGYRIFSTLVKQGWIELARMVEPDLILLDLEESDGSWMELCLELKANKRCAALPLILITSETDEQFLRLACEPGIIDVVRKPLNGIELLFRIRSVGIVSMLQKRLAEEPDFLEALQVAEKIRRDMNQSLQAITGITELLLMKDLEEASFTCARIKKIHQEVERFRQLLTSLGQITCTLYDSQTSACMSKMFHPLTPAII